MKPWIDKATVLLTESLKGPNCELNELDWKIALSDNNARLTEHISAMANLPGGGCLAFGINSEGKVEGVAQAEISTILGKLVNLGSAALEPQVRLDNAIIELSNRQFLIIHIFE